MISKHGESSCASMFQFSSTSSRITWSSIMRRHPEPELGEISLQMSEIQSQLSLIKTLCLVLGVMAKPMMREPQGHVSTSSL